MSGRGHDGGLVSSGPRALSLTPPGRAAVAKARFFDATSLACDPCALGLASIDSGSLMAIDPKDRLALATKRASEVSGGATKLGLVGLVALGVLWLGELRPAYVKLLGREGYAAIEDSYGAQNAARRRIDDRSRAGGNVSNVPERSTIESAQFKRDRLIETVGFDVLGVKIPVRPLIAPIVWNLILLMALLYLAQARRAVWRHLAEAVALVGALNRKWDRADVPESSPLWLAPAPSQDLLQAFEWHTLRVLPNLAATVGLAWLLLLQLDVLAISTAVMHRASASWQKLTTLQLSNGFVDVENLLLTREEAAALGLMLGVCFLATCVVALWWCRRWDPSRPAPDRSTSYRLLARVVILVGGTALVCIVLGRLFPDALLQSLDWLATGLRRTIPVVAAATAAVTGLSIAGVAFGVEALPFNWGRPISKSSRASHRNNEDGAGEEGQEPSAGDGSELPTASRARRRLMFSAFAATVVVIVGGVLWRSRSVWPRWSRFNGARQRRRQREHWTRTDKEPGFYVESPKSQRLLEVGWQPSIKYVDRQKRILFSVLSSKTVGRLLPSSSLPEVPSPRGSRSSVKPGSGSVNLARSSAIFELAALEQISSKKYEAAADLLLKGIEHDLYAKGATRRPSIRLFDLLVRLTIRQRLAEREQACFALVDRARTLLAKQTPSPLARRRSDRRRGRYAVGKVANQPQRVLEGRVRRWKDPSWRKQIESNEQRWKVTLPSSHQVGEKVVSQPEAFTF